jgi:hypothetical protein
MLSLSGGYLVLGTCTCMLANDSDLDDQSLRESFVRVVCNMGSFHNYFSSQEVNTEFSVRSAELQLRFLMSSDLYEETGLFGRLRADYN